MCCPRDHRTVEAVVVDSADYLWGPPRAVPQRLPTSVPFCLELVDESTADAVAPGKLKVRWFEVCVLSELVEAVAALSGVGICLGRLGLAGAKFSQSCDLAHPVLGKTRSKNHARTCGTFSLLECAVRKN